VQIRRRREFLDFVNDLIAKHPGKGFHVVLDNLNTDKPKEDRWLKAHPNVDFQFIPTHSCWLNQIECRSSILSRGALPGSKLHQSACSSRQSRLLLPAETERGTLRWTKAEVHRQQMKRYYSDLCK
jgi:hypothetical protein